MPNIGILSTIGNTPLVRLDRYFGDGLFHLFAKLEAFNPGGSSKDRPARAILESARRSGAVRSGTVVIESSSGNMGIGLAQACRYFGLRFICVVDPKASPLNVRILEAFGAEVDRVVEPDPITGEWLPARLARVQALRREIPDSFWPDQYTNRVNAEAHYQTTMAEVMDQLDARMDFLFVPTSTCGTLRGCSEYVRDRRLPVRIIAVDAAGSLIFPADDPAPGSRLIPGLGAGMQPPLCDRSLVHRVVHVSDRDCVRSCRRLLEREAILAGGSSGGVLAAVEQLRDEIPAASSCVAILPDRGERYLDTVYDEVWVRQHLGASEPLAACADEGTQFIQAPT
jgi:N-(2-amino-2-carboxyethyl)-L-glutamate synthase